MVDFAQTVNAPGAASFGAGKFDFSDFANWGAAFQKGKLDNQQQQSYVQQQQLNAQKIAEGQRQADLAKAMQGGAALDANGNFDPQKAMALFAKFGGPSDLTQLAPLAQQQQAGNTPLFPGQGGAPLPQGQPQPSSIAAPPLPPPAANQPKGDPGTGTITDLVTSKLPNQDSATGQAIVKIAQMMGVDPNAVLTPGQTRRAQGLLQKYAGGDSATPSDAGSLPPSANAVAPKPLVTATPAQGASAQPQQPPAQQPQQAPQPAPQAQPQQQGPIVPQVPLPVDPKTGQPFSDPMQAANFLRDRAARLEAANPKAKPIAERLNGMAAQIENSIAPLKVGPNETIVDPRNSKTLYQGPGAAGMANNRETGATLDADAENYRQTGKLPPNMGRGIQGQGESNAIRQRAAEMEIGEGGNPADWSSRWQSFATQAAGKRALETRAAGLSLAENEASSLIPRVREISSKIKRTEYPTINSLILAAQKGTGGQDVIKLGIAVESLVPVYARVLKPVGQVGQGDMARAHDILDKAWSDGQIGAALDQMQVELKSARSALDKTMSESENRRVGKKEADAKTSAPGDAGKTTEWVRGPDGKLGPAR
jgi:hypothetical protein